MISRLVVLLALAISLTSCVAPRPMGLQFISANTPSPGLQRLQQLEKQPQLAAFFKKQGLPDCTLESHGPTGPAGPSSRGLMLYYLKSGKAWLIVSGKNGTPHALLGPEPIAKKELTFLRAARDLGAAPPQPTQSRAKPPQ
jgi:hypothetical protein